MYFYILEDKLLLSENSLEYYNNLEKLNIKQVYENEINNFKGNIFTLNKLEPLKSRRSFSVSNNELLFMKNEDLNLLKKSPTTSPISPWLKEKIENRKVTWLNTEYKSFKDVLDNKFPILCRNSKLNINVVGLGDVGGTLITGLRLLGAQYIDTIGIYDTDINKIKRWNFECNQINSIDESIEYPEIIPLSEDDLFNCDLFIFCVSLGVPQVGNEKEDVRICQFKGNSKIIKFYAKLARENNFKGIFAVVSDPVDLLCKAAFEYSNKNQEDQWDFKGLAPEQIRGYGLGVMNGRALYYSKGLASEYKNEGRAFGPHGEGLVIANSIENYNEKVSNLLTEKTKNANLEVRAAGFKPYIAPALSSGAISILDTIKGNWNYSANFLGGTFFGCKNKLNSSGIELETLKFPETLFNKLNDTYKLLEKLYASSQL